MPAAEFYGFLCGGGDAQLFPPVFLELGGEDAVFPQGAAAPLQLTVHAGVEVVAVDNQLQVVTRLGKGVAQFNYIKKMVKLIVVCVMSAENTNHMSAMIVP